MTEENLIRAVERHPVLYNVSHKKYKNNSYRRQIWEEVSAELGIQVDECQKVWKRLRERYFNHIRNPRKRSTTISKVVPPSIESMEFLRPFVGDPLEFLPSNNYSSIKPKLAKREATTESNVTDTNKIAKVPKTPDEECDAVDLFCLSVAKDIKKMPPNEQRRIRFEISKLLLTASYEEIII